MSGSKNLIVTCVFNRLYESVLGGRHGRHNHYQLSLATITNFNQDIIVYTTEEDKNTENKLKKLIISWLALDDKLKEYTEMVKDIKTEKKQYEDYILQYMEAST